jgi:predicted peroxiredoxin
VKFVYIVTRGRDDATAASIPLHLAANGSVEVGHDVGVVLAGDAAEIVVGDNAETMEGVGIPPVRDLLGKLRASNVPVYV